MGALQALPMAVFIIILIGFSVVFGADLVTDIMNDSTSSTTTEIGDFTLTALLKIPQKLPMIVNIIIFGTLILILFGAFVFLYARGRR